MVIVPFWMLLHLGFIYEKIRENRQFKKIPEAEVIRYMTSKVVNDKGPLHRILNKMCYTYSRLVGIKPIEYYQKQRSKV
jgi:hypothetical protein